MAVCHYMTVWPAGITGAQIAAAAAQLAANMIIIR